MLTSLLLGWTIQTANAQEMIVQTLDLVKEKYLWLDDLEVHAALVSAAEELESHIPWLIVEEVNGVVSFRKGQEEPFLTVNIQDKGMDEVELVLFTYLSGLENSSQTFPPDVDLEIVLLDGFAREMDRYSIMMYKDRLTSFNERISGNFSGIGCRIQKHDKGLEIQEVFPEGPASLMGLKEGDVILSVDDVPLGALTLQQGVDRLRGETGTAVHIEYLRGDVQEKISLIRAQVRIPNVHWTIQDSMGIITIRNFSDQTMRFMDQALEEFKKEKVNGIVLDLRNNGGGSMLQSCKVVDSFVTSGLTVKTEGRDGQYVSGLMKQYLNRNDHTELKVPMVVLINGGSASASEIVSGSLKLLDRALLIGEKSFGKGVVQTASSIRQGDEPVTLKLTIAQYLLSNGYSVHDKDGIEPHITLAKIDPSGFPFVSVSPEPSDLLLLSDGADKELDFALDVLNHTPSRTVSDLHDTARSLIPAWIEKEDQQIQAVFDTHQIDWGASEPTTIQDLSIEPIVGTTFQSGTSVTLSLQLNNGGSEVSQAMLWLQAENSTSPWDDLVVPVGRIEANSHKVVDIPLDLPLTTMPRYDKIQPILLRPCCVETELDPIYIQTTQGLEPNLSLSTRITEITPGSYDFQLTLENRGVQTVSDVFGRVIWPVEAKSVRMTNNEWRVETLAPNQSLTKSLQFSTEDDLADLPEVLVRIDLEEYPKWFRQQINAVNFTSLKSLSEPKILGIPPVMMSTLNPLVFQHSVQDDGVVVAYEAWWNGEKVHWQDKGGPIELELVLETGHNNLYIEVKDDMGLVTKKLFTVFGLTSEDGESHFVDGNSSTPVFTEE